MTFDELCKEKKIEKGTKEFEIARVFWNENINNALSAIPVMEYTQRARIILQQMRSFDKFDYEKG